jgi:chorismate mutase
MNGDDWRLIAIRGATTVDADTSEQVLERTSEVLNEIISRNGVAAADIVSIIFTATGDVVSDFPAAAARSIGLSRVPLLCSQEIPVTGSVERCIRVLMHCYSALEPDEIRHPYLHAARQLRTDLPE